MAAKRRSPAAVAAERYREAEWMPDRELAKQGTVAAERYREAQWMPDRELAKQTVSRLDHNQNGGKDTLEKQYEAADKAHKSEEEAKSRNIATQITKANAEAAKTNGVSCSNEDSTSTNQKDVSNPEDSMSTSPKGASCPNSPTETKEAHHEVESSLPSSPSMGRGLQPGVPHAVKLRVHGVADWIPQRNSWHGGPPQVDEVAPQVQRRDTGRRRDTGEKRMSVPPSPEQRSASADGSSSSARAFPMSRAHSLKYSGGALHDANDSPLPFDHTYPSSGETTPTPGQAISRRRHKMTPSHSAHGPDSRAPLPRCNSVHGPEPRAPLPHCNSVHAAEPRAPLPRCNSVHDPDSDSSNESRQSPLGARRCRSMRLPPLARVQAGSETGPGAAAMKRLPRTRASYSLSRGEAQARGAKEARAGPKQNDRLAVLDLAEDSGSMSLESDSSTLSLPKSASMFNMTDTGSDPGTGYTNSILASEARKRSYLVGSVGPTSLLGTHELERHFPDRKLRLFIGTWNMNGQVPPRRLADFLLPANLDYVPDLLVVGTQETFPEKMEWEVRLQDTLGPSHVLFHSAALGTLHISVFLRRDLIWYCSVPADEAFSTRPGAQFKTKGCVAVSFILFGTSFLFVNSHLTAHQDNVRDRVKDLKKIYAMLNLPKALPLKKRHDVFDCYDCVFWCGDLNFRLEQSREEVIRDMKDGVDLLETDQLTWLMSQGTIFRSFKEHRITFQPTYKYDPGTDNFDTSSKQRIPSYTDRIVFKHNKSTPVKPLHYDSVQGVMTSDHKPVWGMFEVGVRPGKDSIPLAGGLFNRIVYLEGLKRRSESLKPIIGKGNSPNMCNVS